MAEKRRFFYESFSDYFDRRFRIERLLYEGRTKHQRVHILSNPFFGKMLFLDGKIQSAGVDEHVYHESLVHPSLMTHPSAQNVLVLGGGEGATLREVLRHQTVGRVVMVDIDRELVNLCQKYLPEWSRGAFVNPKTELACTDARAFVEKSSEEFDVVISDLTEPLEKGPSVYLFTRDFFERVFERLKKDGLFVLQAGSTDPFSNQFFCSLARTLKKVFPLVRPYWTFVSSFGLSWGFVLASRGKDPMKLTVKEISMRQARRRIAGLRFYHPGLHRHYFVLPLYLLEDLEKKGRVLTDQEPFIWKL